ncbi:hypothetical protein HD806DRAFT_545850 [Xylariaceae sp. AK1471]|nr:hypothetical protein HD806DRAFT_545850 [Xylariaceae sp. AK1471]
MDSHCSARASPETKRGAIHAEHQQLHVPKDYTNHSRPQGIESLMLDQPTIRQGFIPIEKATDFHENDFHPAIPVDGNVDRNPQGHFSEGQSPKNLLRWVTSRRPRSQAHATMNVSLGAVHGNSATPKTRSPNSRLPLRHTATSEFPQTKQEAQLHIESIRNRKLRIRVGGESDDLKAALNFISNDLYQNPMHFLLEILQNADDSEYQTSQPMMRITYHNHTVRFDTNEVGFRRRDVEAICSVGNSSKKEPRQGTRHIGEKGIGFKSVFRVAQAVFIASGCYFFKFTTEEPLGTLVPAWSPFPGDLLPGFTSIFLQLSPEVNDKALIQELKALDGRILMFLQNLKQVVLKVVEGDNHVTEAVLQQKGGHSVSYGREMPFPTGLWTNISPVRPSKPNYVYSFLPIRDYGFKFGLQADFILVSSREEIDHESEWNKSLREQIPTAFLCSVSELHSSTLRYLWPYYIPLRPKMNDFFQDVWLRTSLFLSKYPIVESVHGTLVIPSSLCLVPKELAGLNGQPLIPSQDSKFTYISASYPVETWTALRSLGVRDLSAEDFLEDLSGFIKKWPIKFQSMPAEWHSWLARVLDPLVAEYEELIMALPFIQLRDGSLTSPECGRLLFPVTSDQMMVPEEINALVVHIDAAEDHSRRVLLQKLKAQTPDNAHVCKIILETHQSENFDPKAVQIANLIKHAVFLYNAGWSSESLDHKVWVVAEDESRYHGYNTYLTSNDPYSMKQILSRCASDTFFANHFPFLHPRYMLSFTDNESELWLQNNFGVSVVPRLVHRSQISGPYAVDPGMKLLPDKIDTIDLLQMLRANWSQYRRWIVPEASQDGDPEIRLNKAVSAVGEGRSHSLPHGDARNALGMSLQTEIKALFSEVIVKCSDGSTKLRQTCLPRKSVLRDLGMLGSDTRVQGYSAFHELARTRDQPQTQEQPIQTYFKTSSALFPVLEIPHPEDSAWDFLGYFGVIVSVTAKNLVLRLEDARERAMTSQISRIYARIQACVGGDEVAFLQQKFQDGKLVYIPEECVVPLPGSRWISLDACVWDGPTCLKKLPRLRNYYSELEDMFCSKLKLKVADLKSIVAEAKLIIPTDSLTYLRSLFKQLSHMSYGTYYHTRQDAGFYDLSDLEIFPVWTEKQGAQFHVLKSPRMEWYIADTPYLLESFEGKIPLLAFEPSMLAEIKDLITYLGWENRKLQKLVTKESAIEGLDKYNPEYTQSLQHKWRCIARLVPVSKSDRSSIINRLRSIRVFEVEGIRLSWNLTNKSGEVFLGQPEEGRAMLTADDELLKVYLVKNDMKIGCPPLELVDELATYCGIDINEHIRLLSHILVQNDIGRIEQDLDRRNVPFLGIVPDSSPVSPPKQTAQPISEVPTTTVPVSSMPLEECSNTYTGLVNVTSSSENTPTIVSSSRLEPKSDMELDLASAVPSIQPKRGRQKLEDGWRSKVYGTNVSSQDSLMATSDERRLGESKTSEIKHSKVSENKAVSLGSMESFARRKAKGTPASSTHFAIRPHMELNYEYQTMEPRNKITSMPKRNLGNGSSEDASQILPTPNSGSNLNSDKNLNRSQRINRTRRRENTSNGLVSLTLPVLAVSHFTQIEESGFIAELYVASALTKVMESDFERQQHWTSYLRSRAGHKPYDSDDPRISTFTLPDPNGKLRKFLGKEGCLEVASLNHDTIFHIQVVHSMGPAGSSFIINSDQVEKARLLSLDNRSMVERKGAFVLAYVFNIHDYPGVAFYPDPWNLHITGLLSLEAYHDQEGWLDSAAPGVYIQNSGHMHTSTQIDQRDSRFQYGDLKPREIRILELFPGEDGELLKGVIRQVHVSRADTFWAMSYVWGTYPSEIDPYYLDTPQGKILLNFSLYSALRAIRKDSTMFIWADGICINQNNPQEKALQISMLGEIFQAAEQVAAWLGHEYNGSQEAMRLLSQIQTESPLRRTKSCEWGPEKVPNARDPVWKHINSLLRRPWFRRVWITQELVLPPKVVLLCGRSELDWDQFFEALTICERECNRISCQNPEDIRLLPDAGPAYALGLARHRQKSEGKRYSLLKWFELFAHSAASMEVDKLFAFLGLAYDGDAEEFMPDYESSTEEVVRRYAKGFILRGQAMELLYRAGASKSYDFCSWIPRWTDGPFPTTISTWDAHGGPFAAGTPSAPLVTVAGRRSAQCAVVDGYIVDAIRSSHSIKWGSGNSLFFFDAMVNFKSLLSFVHDYPTGEHSDDLLLRLPIGNAARPQLESSVEKERNYRAFAAAQESNNEWPSHLRQLILSVDYDQDPSRYLHMPRQAQSVVAQYWQTALAFSNRLGGNAALCFTKEGYVGLVPKAALASDQICLFHGGNVPFVVRRKGPTYTLIGECYIHGIMNGQSLYSRLETCSFNLV